jgi:DNA-binding CsgD family transcriptional regulator
MKEKTPEELLLTLTKREKEVLQLVCQHKRYKQIAKSLFITTSTVKAHMNNTYAKLELDHLDRVERVLKIHTIYCSLLQKQSDQQQARPKIEMIEETPDPEPVSPDEEQVAEETSDPDPISPEDEKMIDEDEKALVAYRPKTNTGGMKVMETRKKSGCTRYIITLILGALIVIGAWYAWQNFLQDIPIVQSIVPQSISHAGAYEVGEWAQQDDVWVRVSEYKVTNQWVSVYIEVWNKKGHEYFFAWGPRENFSMVDNQNNKYTATDTYERQVNLDIDERKKIWGVSSATVQFDNDPIYKPGVTDLYITMEYFATIDKAVFHIDLTN